MPIKEQPNGINNNQNTNQNDNQQTAKVLTNYSSFVMEFKYVNTWAKLTWRLSFTCTSYQSLQKYLIMVTLVLIICTIWIGSKMCGQSALHDSINQSHYNWTQYRSEQRNGACPAWLHIPLAYRDTLSGHGCRTVTPLELCIEWGNMLTTCILTIKYSLLSDLYKTRMTWIGVSDWQTDRKTEKRMYF